MYKFNSEIIILIQTVDYNISDFGINVIKKKRIFKHMSYGSRMEFQLFFGF